MKMKAGTYYVGDPCYVYGEDHGDWLNFLERGAWCADDEPFEYQGYTCFSAGTLWGDGRYRGTDGFMYPVDSGMIGAIPVEMTDKGYISDLSKKVTFDEDFECYKEGGIIVIGHIRINTDDEESDYEDAD